MTNSKCKLFLDLDENTNVKQSLLRLCLIKVSVCSYSARGKYKPVVNGIGESTCGTIACQSYQFHSALSEIVSLLLLITLTSIS